MLVNIECVIFMLAIVNTNNNFIISQNGTPYDFTNKINNVLVQNLHAAFFSFIQSSNVYRMRNLSYIIENYTFAFYL